MSSINEFILAKLELQRIRDAVARKVNIIKMRNLNNQRNAFLRMVSVLGIVMRFGVKMRVHKKRLMNDVRMDKEICTCVVTYKKRYEKKR